MHIYLMRLEISVCGYEKYFNVRASGKDKKEAAINAINAEAHNDIEIQEHDGYVQTVDDVFVYTIVESHTVELFPTAVEIEAGKPHMVYLPKENIRLSDGLFYNIVK